MRRRKGVVDPDVAELGEFRCEGRIVPLFFLVEAGVLQAKNLAVLHRRDRSLRDLADAVVGKGYRSMNYLRERGGDGLERLLRLASLGPAEMGEQDHFAALVGDLKDGRSDAFEPRGVGDAALLHRDVEVDAQQHALALHVDVIEGAECFGH